MALNGRIKQNQSATGVKAFTGAAPQQANGATLAMAGLNIEPNTLSASVYAKATVSTLTLTGKWQGSYNGIQWFDLKVSNDPADVALVTGTGSAVVTSSNSPTVAVSAATANAVNPTVITTSTPHGFVAGQEATIASMGGNTAANGQQPVTPLTPTTFSVPVAGNGTWTSGGTVANAEVCVAAPPAVFGFLYARFSVVSGVGVGAGAGSDECSIAYNWRTLSPLSN